ncbi:MAG: hypothetical protein ACJAZX_001476 [Rickettsiales bacterium]|jgi:hypothetical protein
MKISRENIEVIKEELACNADIISRKCGINAWCN